MKNQLATWLAAHGVVFSGLISATVGVAFKHYWPQIKAWLTGEGTDQLVMHALTFLKNALHQHGATDKEIADIEAMIINVTLRVSQDVQKDQDQKP